MDSRTKAWWEWRAFAPEFPLLNVELPAAFDATEETYVVCAASDSRAVIAGNRIAVDLLDRDDDGIQLWRRAIDAAFPLCQREVREALRQFSIKPPTMYRPEYTPFEFVTDVAACTDGLRVVGVRGVRRRTAADDCVVERSALNLAGQTLQTIAVRSDDPGAVARLVHHLRLSHVPSQSIVGAIKGVLGIATPRTISQPERIPSLPRDFTHAGAGQL